METSIVEPGASPAGAALIAGALEGLQPLPGSEAVLAAIPDGLLEALGFEGKTGQVARLPHEEADVLLVVGLGDEVSFSGLRTASGTAIRQVKGGRAMTLLGAVPLEGATRAVAEGSILGNYRFDSYKSEEGDPRVSLLQIVGGDVAELTAAVIGAEATSLARDWVNTPAMDQSPETLAESMAAAFKGLPVEVEIWNRTRIEEEELGAVLGVAAGSDRDPRVVICRYQPQGAVRHLALVGKGITFDTGGLTLKSLSSMEEMKDDMAGAAAVVAALKAIVRLGLPLKVTSITPLTDNAVGGDATRPGDVLKPLDGPTIEVLNTDAEGRLILADGLGLARRAEPDLIVDVATLTGAARVALGDKIGAVFASDPEVAKQVLDAASVAGESFWEMPLFGEYRVSIDSTVADIKNVSATRFGGAIVAALFLAEYAGDGPWAHLDVAGPARARETSGEQVKGASGVGVRTLVELARSMAPTG